MRLTDWFKKEGKGAASRLSHSTGVAYTTVLKAAKGELKLYDVAKKLSDATGGEVSVAELCEPPPAPKARRKRAKSGEMPAVVPAAQRSEPAA